MRDKLFALYNSDRIAYPIIKQEDSHNARKLVQAIQAKQKVVLVNYKSNNSGKIKNRKIEPFEFTTNYIHIWAYEPEIQKNYMFRISRIENIEILAETWDFEKEHKSGKTDVFRMAGETETPVTLKLSLKGANYLIEQYQLAKFYLNKINENGYYFEGWFANFEGISKFILSTFDDVQIIIPCELKDYLNNKIKNKIF